MKKPFRKWFIIGCPNCHLIQVVRSDIKTRRCPRCNKTIRLDYTKIRILRKVDNPRDAVYMLQKLKEKVAQHRL
jgi:Zn-finger nucleic acid-binding protein